MRLARLRIAAPTAGMLCLAAAGARAGELRGLLQVQYQQLEDVTPQGNQVRRSFLQTYELDHTLNLGGGANLASQLQVNKSSIVGSAERTITPLGSVRLVHPLFGLFASYRPVSQRGADSLTTRQQETQLSGYFGRAGLPRLELSWIRRHQDPRDLRPGDTAATVIANNRFSEATSVTRNVRATHDLGPLSLRAGYGDQTQEGGGPAAPQVTQKNYDAGASLRLAVRRDLVFLLQYDYTFNQRGAAGGPTDRDRNHSASISGGMKLSPKLDWNLNYSFRRSEVRGTAPSDLNDHDGALMFTYHPTTGVTLLSGTGVRTTRTAEQQDVLGYVLVSASADGRVRPGWTGSANVTRSWNRFPGGQNFWVDTYHAGSRFTLARGLDLLADLQTSANGDTAARSSRVVTQATLGAQATPLPKIYLGLSGRAYRSGPGLTENLTRSNSSSVDVRWTPGAADVSFNYTSSGALPRNDPRVSTTTVNVGWRRSQSFQLVLSYTSSSQTQTTPGLQPLVGREVFGGRVLAALSRTVRLTAGISAVDPYRVTRSRAMDMTVTKSFGR
ncbi:MAG TPA: hypothetical protein VMS93_08040 [Candidatus Saccharimonadales bacterium]|nr:hypothetical protein [Candidatus Saccharimonadales bacterium]